MQEKVLTLVCKTCLICQYDSIMAIWQYNGIWHIAINRLPMHILLAHKQHVKLDMKNENKTTNVLILIFSNKNAFWNKTKSLRNDSAKLL